MGFGPRQLGLGRLERLVALNRDLPRVTTLGRDQLLAALELIAGFVARFDSASATWASEGGISSGRGRRSSIVELRFGRGGGGLAEFKLGPRHAVVEQKQRVALLHVLADFDQHLGHDARRRRADGDVLGLRLRSCRRPPPCQERGCAPAATAVGGAGDSGDPVTWTTAKTSSPTATIGSKYLVNISDA